MDNELKNLYGKLMRCQDSTQFLQKVFAYKKKHRRGFGYAEVARRAGFSSRSYVRELFIGKKRLNLKTVEPISLALDLKSPPAKLLKALICFEIATAKNALKQATLLKFKKRVESCKKQLEKQIRPIITDHEALSQGRQFVYAALGSRYKGSSLEDICRRTSFSKARCLNILEDLHGRSLVIFDKLTRRYLYTENHLEFRVLSQEGNAADQYQEHLKALSCKARKNFLDPNSLFFNAVTCVEKRNIPEFKRRLRALLLEYCDEIENEDGNELIRLVVGFGGI